MAEIVGNAIPVKADKLMATKMVALFFARP
jgi:hypothetical protein